MARGEFEVESLSDKHERKCVNLSPFGLGTIRTCITPSINATVMGRWGVVTTTDWTTIRSHPQASPSEKIKMMRQWKWKRNLLIGIIWCSFAVQFRDTLRPFQWISPERPSKEILKKTAVYLFCNGCPINECILQDVSKIWNEASYTYGMMKRK